MKYEVKIEEDDYEVGKYKVVEIAHIEGVVITTTLVKRGLTKTEAETLLKSKK